MMRVPKFDEHKPSNTDVPQTSIFVSFNEVHMVIYRSQ